MEAKEVSVSSRYPFKDKCILNWKEIAFKIGNLMDKKQKNIKLATNILLKQKFRFSRMQFQACQSFCKIANKEHLLQHS